MQRGFAYDSLRLPPKVVGELAGILVDFAEDLHNGTGIWAAYERYNVDFFEVALPLTLKQNGTDLGTGFHPDRFLHFLWVLYPAFIDGLTLSPTHQDLRRVADAVSAFLSEAFSAVPKDSGVKAFQHPQRLRLGREAEIDLAGHPFLHVSDSVPAIHGGAASRRIGYRTYR